MEPVSLIVLGALLEKGSGKFADKVWESGEKWLNTFYKNHRPQAQEKAKDNTVSFLDNLVKRVELLETERGITSDQIGIIQEDPDFGVTLQKAMIAASQTDDKEKHEILARLVSERITVDSKTVFSLASKIACDSVSYATNNQLRLLAFLVNLYAIRPMEFPPKNIGNDEFQEWVEEMISKSLNPFLEMKIGKQDLNHLESISCLRLSNFGYGSIDELYSREDYKFSLEKVRNEDLKTKLKFYWHDCRFMSIQLTTVGSIIGVVVSDLLTKTKTEFIDWE